MINKRLYGVAHYVGPSTELKTARVENVRNKENQKTRLINYGNIIFFMLLPSTYNTDYKCFMLSDIS